jgi:hypothetical protein
MVKMEVMFKNGIAVSDLTRLHNLIKKCGGEGTFVPLENKEAQNTSANNAGDSILPRCECGKLMSLPICTGTIDTWIFKCTCGKTKPVA